MTLVLLCSTYFIFGCSGSQKEINTKNQRKEITDKPCFFLSIKASIYQCKEKGEIKLLQAYVDADVSLAAS